MRGLHGEQAAYEAPISAAPSAAPSAWPTTFPYAMVTAHRVNRHVLASVESLLLLIEQEQQRAASG